MKKICALLLLCFSFEFLRRCTKDTSFAQLDFENNTTFFIDEYDMMTRP